MTLPKIGITTGDFAGIGTEVMLKSLPYILKQKSIPICFAPPTIIEHYIDKFHLNISYHIIHFIEECKKNVLNVLEHFETEKLTYEHITLGSPTKVSTKFALKQLIIGMEWIKKNNIHALVTAPFAKYSAYHANFRYPGHTEWLASQFPSFSPIMIMVHEKCKMALATIHIPISHVAKTLTYKLIIQKITLLINALKTDFCIDHPKIAILGLNPHAGEDGYIGREEKDIIIPAIEDQRKKQDAIISGPFSADGFFGFQHYRHYDAVLTMYHDQGFIPFKAFFGKFGCQYTAGLPIIRCAPIHGTAFDIAELGIADPSSMIAAYQLAEKLVMQRQSTSKAP